MRLSARLAKAASAASRVGVACCQTLIERRLCVLSPPLLILASIATAFIYFGISDLPSDGPSNLLRSLLQVVAAILGVNILGLTINTNQLGQTAGLRRLVLETEEATKDICQRYYNAHPRDQSLQRHTVVSRLIRSAPISVFVLRDEQKNEDFYVYRPEWDGAWYQVQFSPFSDFTPRSRRHEIRLAHEIVLCAVQALRLTRDMRRSGCALLSSSRGTNGSRWYLDALAQMEDSKELMMSQFSPVTLNREAAGRIVNLALASNHYMSEEFGEHSSSENWEPHSLARFICYYIEHFKWMGFLWIKLQLLRLARAGAKAKCEGDLPVDLMNRFGISQIEGVRQKISALLKSARSEFGAANRFWLVRQAAIPGLGWAMAFLFCAAVVWPLSSLWIGGGGQLIVFAIVYGLGVLALSESLVFAASLIWGRRSGAALESVGSRPPGP